MGIFSLFGSILGAGSAKKGSRQAMEAQVASSQQAIGEQRRQYDTTRADFQPYLNQGTQALGQLGDLVGTNGGAPQSAAIEALKASPFYQQLFGTGQEAVLANASATGGLRGGNTETGLADFGRDTLSSTIDRQLASLGGLADMGLGATGQIGQFGAHTADAVAGQYGVQGDARANNFLTRGRINAGMWNNIGAFGDQALSAAAGAGGFGGAAGAGGGGFSGFLNGLLHGGK